MTFAMRFALAFVLTGMSFWSSAGFAATSKLHNFDLEHAPGEFIVKFYPGVRSTEADTLTAAGARVIHHFRASGAERVRIVNAKSLAATDAAALSLANDPSVEYIEADTIIHVDAMPNDPRLSTQWGVAKISAPAAWEVNTGTRNVVVAIIDTGIDYNHPDIRDNYWHNQGEMGMDADGHDKSSNGIDDDGDGYIDDWRGWDFVNHDNDPMDDHNHGTHCAGVIGASGNNGVGVAGVNWNVSVVGLKFIGAGGSGTLADATEAIEYATHMGFNLSSNSWAGGGYSETLKAAIQEAQDHGILFVAAAGNDGSSNDATPSYPSSYDLDNVIAVAATDENDQLANFSNYGVQSVDIAAPGVGIVSTIRNGSYQQMSGTSMATPHVAGAAALIKSVYPDYTWQQIKEKLLSSVDAVDVLNGKVASGGRLNLEKAIQ